MMKKIFKIGEQVIALTNPPDNDCQPRVKGQMYTVCDVMYCAGCGIQMINIGPKTDGGIQCHGCGNIQSGKGLYWTDSDLFERPSDFQELIAEAVAEERYEDAAQLKKLLDAKG